MSSLDEHRARLSALLEAADLMAHRDAILATARPSLRLSAAEPTEQTGRVGASRFGGAADLPSADAWPYHGETPLVFVLQLDLAEVATALPESGLPDSGLLSFFAFDLPYSEHEPSDDMFEAYGKVGRVLHQPDVAALMSVEPPYGDELPHIALHAAQLRPELCLPPLEGPDFDGLGLKGTEVFSTYWDQVWMDRLALGDDGEPLHRLLGHPDMNFNYHMARPDGAKLLLQLDADDAIGWEHGDAQPKRFILSPAALAMADFEAVWCNSELE